MNKDQWYPALLHHFFSFEQKMPGNFESLLFPKLTKPIYYAKDTIVLKPGEVANWSYWPVLGYTRTYEAFKPEPDRELYKQSTIGISIPGKLNLPAKSFMNRSASTCFLEITKGSVMVGLNYDAFKALGKQVPELLMLYAQMLTIREENRLIEGKFKGMPRPQAYKAFLAHFGSPVELHVFQRDIASFIGMSPETLSRIRGTRGCLEQYLRR